VQHYNLFIIIPYTEELFKSGTKQYHPHKSIPPTQNNATHTKQYHPHKTIPPTQINTTHTNQYHPHKTIPPTQIMTALCCAKSLWTWQVCYTANLNDYFTRGSTPFTCQRRQHEQPWFHEMSIRNSWCHSYALNITADCRVSVCYKNMLKYKEPETWFQDLLHLKEGYNTDVWTQQITPVST